MNWSCKWTVHALYVQMCVRVCVFFFKYLSMFPSTLNGSETLNTVHTHKVHVVNSNHFGNNNKKFHKPMILQTPVCACVDHLFVLLHCAECTLQLLQVLAQAAALSLECVTLRGELSVSVLLLLHTQFKLSHLNLQLTSSVDQLCAPLLGLLQCLLLLHRDKEEEQRKDEEKVER